MSRVTERETTPWAALPTGSTGTSRAPPADRGGAEARRAGTEDRHPRGQGSGPSEVTRCLRRCANPARACVPLHKAVISSPELRF